MEGFPEFVFVLIFIAFSILEGVGRKRKAQARKDELESRTGSPKTATPSRTEARPQGGTPGSAQQEKSPPTAASTVPRSGSGQTGSEGLIPKDVWEEILGLARGTPPPSRGSAEPVGEVGGRPAPREEKALEEVPATEAQSLEPLYVEHHRVASRKAPEEGSDGTETSGPWGAKRAQGKGRGRGGGGEGKGRGIATTPGGAGRHGSERGVTSHLFGTGSVQDLRKAVILSEVLGKPVGMRDEPGGGGEGV